MTKNLWAKFKEYNFQSIYSVICNMSITYFRSSGAYYTTTGKPLYLFGEQLTPPHGNFYCSHVSFPCQLLPPQEL